MRRKRNKKDLKIKYKKRRKFIFLTLSIVFIFSLFFKLKKYSNCHISASNIDNITYLPSNINKEIKYFDTKNIKLVDKLKVSKSKEVDISYFDDAVFLGNSRTETFIPFASLSNAKSFAYKGFSIDKVLNKPIVKTNKGKLTVIDALKDLDFSKVYIMFGFNETGWNYPHIFIEKYEEVISKIRQINPDAVIYIQSILPVSKSYSKNNEFENNKNINSYNDLILDMSERTDTYFLNVREVLEDKEGNLPEDYAFDGVHLKKEYALIWLDYLKTHTINYEKD